MTFTKGKFGDTVSDTASSFNYFIFSLEPETSRLARYLTPLADQMVHNTDYDELNNFFQNKSKIFSHVERSVKQSLETIRINSQWQQKNYKEIGRLLQEY